MSEDPKQDRLPHDCMDAGGTSIGRSRQTMSGTCYREQSRSGCRGNRAYMEVFTAVSCFEYLYTMSSDFPINLKPYIADIYTALMGQQFHQY